MDDFDPDVVPPPDIVVEVDRANQSRTNSRFMRLSTFPRSGDAMSRRKRIQMHRLRHDSYVAIESSGFFPILTPQVLLNFLQQRKTQGQIAALTSFRAWLRAQTQSGVKPVFEDPQDIIGAMKVRSTHYKDAVDHLPEGALLIIQDATWEDYEQLLEDLAGRAGVRVSYDGGKLEVMSPLPEHEEYKEFIAQMIYALRDELDLNVEPRGSATWKRKRDSRGTEPDACFYVANADRVIGKRNIDLSVDPPPDLVVEIDTTNESLSKFPIYSMLGVPEIWRYDCRRSEAFIYELRDSSYAVAASSRSFPVLTGTVLAGFIEQSKTLGHKAALAAFRQWIRKAKS